MSEQPFNDGTEPFDPNDVLPKPLMGDILILKNLMINEDMPRRVVVVWTWDSLAESWDPVGESAWQQRDVNDVIGFRGHWYAYVTRPDDGTYDHWSVASYEVEGLEA